MVNTKFTLSSNIYITDLVKYIYYSHRRLLRARQRTNSAPVNAYDRRRETTRRKYNYHNRIQCTFILLLE